MLSANSNSEDSTFAEGEMPLQRRAVTQFCNELSKVHRALLNVLALNVEQFGEGLNCSVALNFTRVYFKIMDEMHVMLAVAELQG